MRLAHRVHSVQDHVHILELLHAGRRQHVHDPDDVVVVELSQQPDLADHSLGHQHVVERRHDLVLYRYLLFGCLVD